ncbi:TetR family transcriptional regulator [Duganella sp. Leaf126]|uniref:CerR family C-terminal domain-containing protein n=1 Tax=Duganella sp. Leaf126 TaxID=1736266 RepID=UPI0006F74487|nr:CerR family C-terminal domain-containing protein [Duganella sp. Leaf126]KQQ33605.1 TetR family transcriptional regulator [Duganella sp. Leaf126]
MPTTSITPPADEVRKPRADGEQSRDRLLHTAMRLFGQHGFSKTSTRAIAGAAGVNVAAISYYFGDKAGLYQACFGFLCTTPGGNVAAFEQPHFTLRESLQGYYRQMLAPLMQHEEADVMLRLFYREMLEPTGLWQREIDNNIKPEHSALLRVLCRHLGTQDVTPDLQRLAHAIPGLCVTLLIGRDVIAAVSPELVASPAALAAWAERLVDYAEALVQCEQTKLQRRTA